MKGDCREEKVKEFLVLDETAITHSNIGDFPINPNPKKAKYESIKGGGHGQDNIIFLQNIGFDYYIEYTYGNGVRIGYIPLHKNALKNGTKNKYGQSWFPASWTKIDIKNAGEYVINNTPNLETIPDGQPFYEIYKGIRVGVIKTKGKPSTVFPDGNMQPQLNNPSILEYNPL